MERGILMEVRGRQGILLTRTGEFRRVDLAAGGWQVGDEIAAPLARAGRPWVRPLVAVAAAVLVLFGGPVGYWQWSLLQPSVVLAMEINPSVEFTINGKGMVIAARGLNPDGEALLAGLAWQNRSVEEVVEAATDKAVAMGKLDPTSAEGAIVVTVAPVKGEELPETKAEAITSVAKAAVESAVQVAAAAQGKQPQAKVASTPVTKAEVEEARSEGLTLPEYVLYKSLQEKRPELKPEDFQKKGPGAVLKELGLPPAEVLSAIGHGHGKDGPPGHGRKDDHDGTKNVDKGRGSADQKDRANPDDRKSQDRSGAPKNQGWSDENRGRGKSDDKEHGGSADKDRGKSDDKDRGKSDDKGSSDRSRSNGEGQREGRKTSNEGPPLNTAIGTSSGASSNGGGATGADTAQGAPAAQGGKGSDAKPGSRRPGEDDRSKHSGSSTDSRGQGNSAGKGGRGGSEAKGGQEESGKDAGRKRSGKDD